jgi:hypothetical protein
MADFVPLFSVEEIDALDAKQLEILRRAILSEVQNQIRTNQQFRNALRQGLDPTYNQLRPQAARRAPAARRPRGGGSGASD